MNVRTLCLSILFEEDATGYEIRKLCTEGECAYFVEASFGAIYPALARLEDEGLLTSRVEPQEGKPSRKVYSITDAGRRAFEQSLFEPIEDDVFRSPFLLFARHAALLPADLVEARLKERLATMDAEIAELEELAEKRAGHAADDWVVGYGLACLRVARDYLRTHMRELIAVARPSAPSADAAE